MNDYCYISWIILILSSSWTENKFHMNFYLFGFSKQDTNTKCIELAKVHGLKEKELSIKCWPTLSFLIVQQLQVLRPNWFLVSISYEHNSIFYLSRLSSFCLGLHFASEKISTSNFNHLFFPRFDFIIITNFIIFSKLNINLRRSVIVKMILEESLQLISEMLPYIL